MPKSDNRGSVSWASLTFTIAVLIVITTVPVVVFVLESPGNESEVRDLLEAIHRALRSNMGLFQRVMVSLRMQTFL